MAKRSWMDWTRPLFRIGNRWEVMLLRRLGVSGMSLLSRQTLLVIETVGRRTGRRRAAPVAFWEDGGSFYIGGGAGGMTRVDWVANLRHCTDASIVVRRTRIKVFVHELDGDENVKAREHAMTLWPGVPRYERRSGRRVPYFRLTPSEVAQPGRWRG